ncbi:YraN family protein [Patescibacteria group bacterium]|nr:YraN family protein [Patescibacteria group bacterium]
MKGFRKKLGAWGEELARKYFEEKGYEFVASNWQKKSGEIDLICRKENEIVFVEVKTRTTPAFGWGEDAVTKKKKEKISQTMDFFLLENENYNGFFPRFDILVVEIFSLRPRFVHFEDVEL